MLVKICGITNEGDARAAVEAGASAVGFNFYPRSPRFVSVETAAAIDAGDGALRVGIFVDEDPRKVLEIARRARLDVVQLHGSEDPHTSYPGVRVWKAFRVTDTWDSREAAAFEVEAILLDGPAPGTGSAFDWQRARNLPQKIILAGGLDDGNVRKAVETARPWGVDACSRLESAPGIKDHDKMRRFIAAAKAYHDHDIRA